MVKSPECKHSNVLPIFTRILRSGFEANVTKNNRVFGRRSANKGSFAALLWRKLVTICHSVQVCSSASPTSFWLQPLLIGLVET